MKYLPVMKRGCICGFDTVKSLVQRRAVDASETKHPFNEIDAPFGKLPR